MLTNKVTNADENITSFVEGILTQLHLRVQIVLMYVQVQTCT